MYYIYMYIYYIYMYLHIYYILYCIYIIHISFSTAFTGSLPLAETAYPIVNMFQVNNKEASKKLSKNRSDSSW